MRGKIKEKLSGYGFVRADNTDFFFHKSALKDEYFNSLRAGQEVNFVPDYDDPKGPSTKEIYVKADCPVISGQEDGEQSPTE